VRAFDNVVRFLGATLILSLLAIAVLAGLDKLVPNVLENMAVGALTGLAGLLSRRPEEGPQEVRVVNVAGDPVPVEDDKG
jgi:hypothetical protein